MLRYTAYMYEHISIHGVHCLSVLVLECETCTEWCRQSLSHYTAVHSDAQVTNVATAIHELVCMLHALL